MKIYSGKNSPRPGKVAALCGGVGGAKLAYGLSRIMPPERLSIIVNTGDDFRHLGWLVCPDIDTVLYTLAELADPLKGWGREGESWRFMEAVAKLGGPAWFALGDSDLATSAVRSDRLARGESLTTITADFAARFGVKARILPATNDKLSTLVDSDQGRLAFQEYFVARRCAPRVHGLIYDGAANARVTPEVQAVLADPELAAIVICPSNPYLSIDPMLAIPGFRGLLRAANVPVLAVSPIVGGRAIKGPLAKIMNELCLEVSPRTIAAHYAGLIDKLVVDEVDRALALKDVEVVAVPTVMKSQAERVDLARHILNILDLQG